MSRPLMETYHGLVRTPVDAIKLFEACRLGILPRVQRRLSEKERQAIRSGSIFVWDEREAGMRRWTDGKSWSASRVSGSFLTYREMEGKRYREMDGKRGGNVGSQRRGGAGRTPDSGRGSDEDQDDGEPGGYRYKPDGLMKQSFSITTSNGQHLHLISYFTKSHSQSSELPEPSTDPQLRSIVPPKGLYPESSWNDSSSLPALTRGPMAGPGQYMMTQQHHPQQQQQQPQPPPPPPPPPQQQQQQQQQQQYPPLQYAPAPQHQHRQQNQQGGYSWPLSPVATPPYATNSGHSQQHYTTSPYPPQQSQPQHLHHQPQPQSQPAPPPPSNYPTQYSPSRLPPPAALLQQPPQQQQQQAAQIGHSPPPHQSPQAQYAQYQPRSQYQPPPRVESPRAAHLQAAAAQAVLNAARNPQPTPPMLHASVMTRTPPNRALSISPPRSSHSEATSITASTAASSLASTNKASLSALLHPTPSNSEPGSANPGTGSAGSSPRGMDNMGLSEDVRAIRVLDRNFGL